MIDYVPGKEEVVSSCCGAPTKVLPRCIQARYCTQCRKGTPHDPVEMKIKYTPSSYEQLLESRIEALEIELKRHLGRIG